MSEWTKEERQWISRAKRLLRDKPQDVLLYLVDDSLVACRNGTSSEDLSDGIGYGIGGGAVLTDIHDDMERGGGGYDHNRT